MKFGLVYEYWGTEWNCDYISTAKKVKSLGFDVMEIGADHLFHMSESEILALKNIGDELKLEFSTNSGPSKEYDLSSPVESIRKNGISYYNTILEKMNKLGSKVLIGALCSYWPCDFTYTDKAAAWKHSIACLKEIGKTAEKYDIEIALEVLNRNETYILTDCAEAKDYVAQIGCSKVGILLDTYHMNIEEDNMFDAIRNAGNQLNHLHVGENNRKLPGMNHSIDWPAIGKALRDINYQKYVVMEPFLLSGGDVGRDIRVWRDLSGNADEAKMDELAKTSLAYLKKCCEA